MSGPNDSKRYEILSSLWSMHQKRPRDATVSYVETKQLSCVFCPAAGGSKAWMAALCVCVCVRGASRAFCRTERVRKVGSAPSIQMVEV